MKFGYHFSIMTKHYGSWQPVFKYYKENTLRTFLSSWGWFYLNIWIGKD